MFIRLWQRCKDWYRRGFHSYVVCRRVTYNVKEHGYLEPNEVSEQYWTRVNKWYFITFKKTELFRETVPLYAILESACMGSTSWRSAAPDWMFKEHAEYIINKERKRKTCKL